MSLECSRKEKNVPRKAKLKINPMGELLYCPKINEIKKVKKKTFSNEIFVFVRNLNWNNILKIPKRLRDSKFGRKKTEETIENLSNDRNHLFLNFLIKKVKNSKMAEKWIPEGDSK